MSIRKEENGILCFTCIFLNLCSCRKSSKQCQEVVADHPEHDPVTEHKHVPKAKHLSCLQVAGCHSHPIETTDSCIITLGQLNFQLNKVSHHAATCEAYKRINHLNYDMILTCEQVHYRQYNLLPLSWLWTKNFICHFYKGFFT